MDSRDSAIINAMESQFEKTHEGDVSLFHTGKAWNHLFVGKLPKFEIMHGPSLEIEDALLERRRHAKVVADWQGAIVRHGVTEASESRGRKRAARLVQSALASQKEPKVDRSWLALVVDEDDLERVEMDLDYVMTRLERSFTRRQAKIWMESHNRELDARPVDVLVLRSTADVLRAIEVVEQQAY